MTYIFEMSCMQYADLFGHVYGACARKNPILYFFIRLQLMIFFFITIYSRHLQIAISTNSYYVARPINESMQQHENPIFSSENLVVD